MKSDFEARIAGLDDSHKTRLLDYLEYLEWKQNERPVLRENERISMASAMAPRLRAVREALGKTEEEAAEVAQVSLANYLTYEGRGPRRWGTRKITDYCDKWNVSLDWLVRGDGSMFRGAVARRACAASTATVIPFDRRHQ